MRTEAEKLEWQKQAYGCAEKDLMAGFSWGGSKDINDAYDLNFYATCILSDAQEEIARGNAERGRQYINRAKFFIGLAQDVARRAA